MTLSVLKLITPPALEPLTLVQGRKHLRLTASGSPLAHPEDDLVSAAIAAARRRVENHTHRALVTQAWMLELDRWPDNGHIVLPKPPLMSVESIQYVDLAGDAQTLDPDLYQVLRPTGPAADRGEVIPAYQAVLPSMRCYPGSLLISFTAGYGSGGSPDDSVANIPEDIKSAMKLLLGHYYENRQAVITGTIATELPAAVDALLSNYVSTVFP